MKDVYFKKINNFDDKELINNTCYEMLKEVIQKENISLSDTVPMKVHFGEKGNTTFMKPNNFDGIKKYFKENNINSCYIDTNVLYKGSRTIEKDHINTALEHGFTDYDVVIADGDEANPYYEVPINGKYFSKCKLGTKFQNYENYVVMAHFKGHAMGGMGASIKQLAMGFASRGGKLAQHSDSIPTIDENLCIACGACERICPVKAIDIPEKAIIDANKCIGCASCSNVCPVTAIANTWESSNFHEKLSEYAYGAAKDKQNIYFVFAFNITEGCDCEGRTMEPIAPNIGIFMSTDPVAVDSAVLSTFESLTGNKDFATAWTSIDYAEELGMGSKEYNLIEM